MTSPRELRNNPRTVSTGRDFAACGALLRKHRYGGGSTGQWTSGGSRSRSSKTRSPIYALQPAADPYLLPVLTRFQDAQVDAQLKPEAIQALLREVEERHKAANEKLRYYYVHPQAHGT